MNMKQARHHLNLSRAEFAALHQQSTHSVRRWELAEGSLGYRKPNGSAVAFTQALLDGYRPKGWEAK